VFTVKAALAIEAEVVLVLMQLLSLMVVFALKEFADVAIATLNPWRRWLV